MKKEIHERIVLAMALHMVMEGMFHNLDGHLKQEPKMRFNMAFTALSGFNRYMMRMDKATAAQAMQKAMEIGELFDSNKQIYDLGGEESGASGEDSEVQGEV